MGLSAILSRDQGGWWVPSSSLLSALLEVIAVSKKGNCGFSVLSRQGPYGIVLDSQCNLKGNFHDTWKLWCTANEGGGYPQISARTHLGGINLNFQMEQYIYKRKSDGIINLKGTSEKLLLAASATVVTKNSADVSVTSFRKFIAAAGATSISGHSLQAPSLTRSWWSSRSKDIWCSLVSGLTVSFCERLYINLPIIVLCNTDCPLCYVDTAVPGNNQGAHSVGLMWGVHLESSAHAWHNPQWTPMRGHAWSLLLQRSWRDWKGRPGNSWEGCDQGGISGRMDHCSSGVHCCSTWGGRLVWRHTGALRAYSAVPHLRLEHSNLPLKTGLQFPLLRTLDGQQWS